VTSPVASGTALATSRETAGAATRSSFSTFPRVPTPLAPQPLEPAPSPMPPERRSSGNRRSGLVRRPHATEASASEKRGARKHTRRKPVAAASTKRKTTTRPSAPRAASRALDVPAQIDHIIRAGGDGTLIFGGRASLDVSSLDKLFFPKSGITKGDVMRYYARVAPPILPSLKDRPLILKRHPNGIAGPSFFQQNAGAHVPAAVRVADVETENGERATRLIGGDLLTLLYTVQLGTIAVHPWQSRLPTIEYADYSTIDLDPGEGVAFSRIVELAKYIEEDLIALRLHAALKTSGSRGLHIVLPLPARTSYARSASLAGAIAAHVVAEHPKLATLERRIDRRPKGTIYVDAQQNARGKSVASAYSVREREGAPVSAPLRWSELTPALRISDFTIATMPLRIEQIGDVWGEAMKRRNASRDISRILGEA